MLKLRTSIKISFKFVFFNNLYAFKRMMSLDDDINKSILYFYKFHQYEWVVNYFIFKCFSIIQF